MTTTALMLVVVVVDVVVNVLSNARMTYTHRLYDCRGNRSLDDL